MERARKVGSFWNWLPTFRAAAETEHLGRAAELLGVSGPAVTRTITLLEHELGVELLARQGRGVRLTDAGRLLQGAVRDAMRTIYEASRQLEQSGFVGGLRVACASPTASTLLLPVVRLLAERHPQLSVEVFDHALDDVCGALRRGTIDVALLRSELPPDGVRVERLGSLAARVYASPSLGLSTRTRHRLEALGRHPFVALSPRHGDDPFPASVPRRVALTAETFEQAQRAAIQLPALVVLPETLGNAAVEAGDLVGLRTEALRPIPLRVAWRTPIRIETNADVFVEVVREVARTL